MLESALAQEVAAHATTTVEMNLTKQKLIAAQLSPDFSPISPTIKVTTHHWDS
jgi:hypothetical protein